MGSFFLEGSGQPAALQLIMSCCQEMCLIYLWSFFPQWIFFVSFSTTSVALDNWREGYSHPHVDTTNNDAPQSIKNSKKSFIVYL